jgi:glycosyltransferase involved in cell wall biosynthesis
MTHQDGSRQARCRGLSLWIPVLNEEGAIGRVLARALRLGPALRTRGIEAFEIIVVDDGSCDMTPAIVGTFPNVRLIRHGVNRGYGAALKTAFANAAHDLVAFIDGDGTYPPEALPAMCQPLLNDTADLVVGLRGGAEPSRMPAVRRVGNLMFAWLLAVTTRSDRSPRRTPVRARAGDRAAIHES